jgi:hypothetical protein
MKEKMKTVSNIFFFFFEFFFQLLGCFYLLKPKKPENRNFIVRILKPKSEGILLAFWRAGKISFITQSNAKKESSIEIRTNKY